MATFNFYVNGTKRKLVPVYIRFSAGVGTFFMLPSGLPKIDPDNWSNKDQTLKSSDTDDDDFLLKLAGLKIRINKEIRNHSGEFTKEWLKAIIDKYHNKKSSDATSLNDYISRFITEAWNGDRKNKGSLNLAPGTIRIIEGLQRIFGIYQGIYSDKDIKKIEEKNEKLKLEKKSLIKIRPKITVDFDDIDIDFYNSFRNFLSDEGYALNTMGRFIGWLKIIMKKSLQEKLHNNRDFQHEAFRKISSESFSIVLSPAELDKIYNYNLSSDKRVEVARDAFIILYETCLRISDYSQIDVNIRTIEGKRFIDIYQTKTKKRVLIPLTTRFEAIWNKYDGKLPLVPDQKINKYIKTVAFLCGITETVRWPDVQYGKTFERSAKKYEKITCHTARRSGATILYKDKVPLSDIIILLGHHSELQTRQYLKITPEEAALRLSEYPHYSKLRVS
jgi:integrase